MVGTSSFMDINGISSLKKLPRKKHQKDYEQSHGIFIIKSTNTLRAQKLGKKISSSTTSMADWVAKFLAFLAITVVKIACFRAEDNIIQLGSRLYPQNNSSWLSPSGIIAFGFYKKANGFAVGIWLQAANSEPLITWTANRDDPPIPPEAYLEFASEGRLILSTKQSLLDVFNLTRPATSFSLLDSGNLIAYNGTRIIWQSFDHPTDTILGGQVVHLGYSLYSSVSKSDHSRGRFLLAFQGDANLVAYPVNVTPSPSYAYWAIVTSTLIPSGSEQLILTERGRLYLYLSSSSNNDSVHDIAQSSFNQSAKNTIYRAILDADGNFRLYSHVFDSSGNSTSRILWSALDHECEVKGYCGVNSYCSFDASRIDDKCLCFPGFIYLDPERKFLGCYRNFTYERFCGREESSQLTQQGNMSIGGYPYASVAAAQEDCRDSCRNDCNCWTALYESGRCNKFRPPLLYSTQGQKNQSGIAFIKQSRNVSPSPAPGQNALLDQKSRNEGKRKREMILILAPPFGFLSVLFTFLAVSSFLLYRSRTLKYQKLLNMEILGLRKEFTLRSFSYSELEKATDGFRRELGKISYGKIYEGIISEGSRKVAVNRLEKVDDEGRREFIAEITAMGRIYHKNVVQLVGFCLEGAKRLLVYEFMTNRSLADILDDVEKRPLWKQRIKIALDVARGIRYLHEECDTRIVHCKIRPKNILVDDNLTAKLSGFGLAKLLAPNQTEKLSLDREKRGYSAPEWQKNDLISEKVDVYSYGVLLLEIICCTSDEEINVGNSGDETFPKVYRYFKSKDFGKLVGNDQAVDVDTLERFVKVGLCCIQDESDLRPSMKNVILMLEGTLDIPSPLPPTLTLVNVSSQ